MQIACPACHTRYTVPDNAIGAQGRIVRCAKCWHSWHQDGFESAAAEEIPAASTEPQPAPAAEPAPPPAEPAPAEPAPEPFASETAWSDAPPAPRGWADVGATATAEPVAEVAEADADIDEFTETATIVDEVEIDVEPDPVVEEEPAAAAPAFAEVDAEPVDAEYEDLDQGESRWKRLLLICAVLLVVAAAVVYGAARYFGAPAWLPFGQTAFAPASENLVLDFPLDDQDRRELPNGRLLFAANGTITNTGSRSEHVPPVLVVLRDSQKRIVYSWEMEASRSELGPGESVKVSQMVTDVPRSAEIMDIGWKPS